MVFNVALELIKKMIVLVAVSPITEKILASIRLVYGGMSPILRIEPVRYLP